MLGIGARELLTDEPEPAGPAPGPATTAEQNRALIEDLVGEVVNHGNLAVADHVLAPAYVIHGPFPDLTVDRERFKRLIGRMRRAFPDIRVRIDDIVADASRVVVRWTLTGTHRGAVRDVLPSGTPIAHAGIAIFGMSGGRVTEAWMTAEASDRDLFRRLGLLA